ncbi:MAG: hypothetical protein KDB27_09110 [Planctomycetales bacterium]|nr:hypothetical protein [Planctomycetales bacterium]
MPVGGGISQADDFRTVASALEFYLPAVLRKVHAFWKHESLDGVFHEIATKTALRQIEIAGLCIFISDQTLAPFHIQLRFASDVDEIEWLDCRLGEIRDDVMVRVPYNVYFNHGGNRAIAERLYSIEWRFHVGFGNASVDT